MHHLTAGESIAVHTVFGMCRCSRRDEVQFDEKGWTYPEVQGLVSSLSSSLSLSFSACASVPPARYEKSSGSRGSTLEAGPASSVNAVFHLYSLYTTVHTGNGGLLIYINPLSPPSSHHGRPPFSLRAIPYLAHQRRRLLAKQRQRLLWCRPGPQTCHRSRKW